MTPVTAEDRSAEEEAGMSNFDRERLQRERGEREQRAAYLWPSRSEASLVQRWLNLLGLVSFVAHPVPVPLTLTFTRTLSLTFALSPPVQLACALTLPHSGCHTFLSLALSLTLPPSLPPSLTPSLPHSLTPSLTHSLTHSLSLPH